MHSHSLMHSLSLSRVLLNSYHSHKTQNLLFLEPRHRMKYVAWERIWHHYGDKIRLTINYMSRVTQRAKYTMSLFCCSLSHSHSVSLSLSVYLIPAPALICCCWWAQTGTGTERSLICKIVVTRRERNWQSLQRDTHTHIQTHLQDKGNNNNKKKKNTWLSSKMFKTRNSFPEWRRNYLACACQTWKSNNERKKRRFKHLSAPITSAIWETRCFS